MDFPKNRLAAHELPPGGTCVLHLVFLGFFMNRRAVEGDSPGGTSWIAQFSLFDKYFCGVMMLGLNFYCT